jgi:putative membrane protein
LRTLALIAVGLVAAIHLYILYLEMFLWDTPRGRATFGLTPELAGATKTLAANQGLYNGFLAAGLIWGLVTSNQAVMTFFLLCVAVAGVYGAVTVNRRIFVVQTVPALLALLLLVLA